MMKKSAMSTLGYAIILVIILGVVMIISAPMFVDSVRNSSKNNPNNNPNSYENQSNYDKSYSNAEGDNRGDLKESDQDVGRNYDANSSSNSSGNMDFNAEIMNLERRMLLRLSDIEQKQSQIESNLREQTNSSDKYVCSIEGVLDSNNNVVAIDNQSSQDLKSQKFVFVCQYSK